MAGRRSDPARSVDLAELDLKVLKLVTDEGKSFRQIAAELDISKSYAHLCFKRAMTRIDEEIAALAHRYLREHLAECQADRVAVLEVLHADHITVSNGQIVRLDGQPITDYAPVLAAVDRMLKIRDQEAGYLGIKAKTEVNVSGGVSYQLVGVDPKDLV